MSNGSGAEWSGCHDLRCEDDSGGHKSGEIPIVGRDASPRDVIRPVPHLAGAKGLAEDKPGHALQLQVNALQDG